VEELVYRGVARRYIPQQQSLQSPRGHIDCRELVRLGGIREARLPCLFFDRSKDWHLNQIVNAGLYFGARLTEDPYLRGRVQLLSEMLHDVSRVERLSENDVDLAEAKLSRLTEAYRPALTLIRLLCGMLGLGFDASQRSADTPGYLFDMNIFFQRLVSRFLRENLTDSRIKDQMQVRSLFTYVPDANPRMRSAPALRPDYAYFRGPDLIGFLDAKYRDIWQSSLPTEWLYQLSVYALASPSYTGILLYPSMAHEARDERIEIRQPITRSHRGPACVVVRPVSMNRLSELVHPTQKFIFDRERRLYARRMVN
jgi:5-methylcytosine-specific restriction enzyme subunit McrC